MLSISPVWDDLLQAGTDELMKILLTFMTVFKRKGPRAGEMTAQQLKALLPLPEAWGSVPRSHMVVHNHLSLQSQGTLF